MNDAPPGGGLETLVERRGRAGFITLNRPAALNALTQPMVRAIAVALDAFERDPAIERVVLKGAGERAFCAGGDIRALYDQGRAGEHEAQLAFWREEYQLDRRIKRYAKPIVALIDGLVMGGGVGVSAHASHRVAGEGYAFAMPEVRIGFFPDVGATFLLPRLPRRIGRYLALTGARAKAGDALAFGLAEAFVPRARMAGLERALETTRSLDAALGDHAAPPPPSELVAAAPRIEAWFAPDRLADVEAALAGAERAGDAFAAAAREAMAAAAPTSLALALEQMRRGATMGFEEALRTEYRIVARVCRGADFYEGVRATIIDKDGRPRWLAPPSDPLEAERAVAAYFAPLGADELRFSGEER